MGALRDVCVADSRAGREWASGSPMRAGADPEDWLPWRALPACLPAVPLRVDDAVLCYVVSGAPSQAAVCSQCAVGRGQVRSGQGG